MKFPESAILHSSGGQNELECQNLPVKISGIPEISTKLATLGNDGQLRHSYMPFQKLQITPKSRTADILTKIATEILRHITVSTSTINYENRSKSPQDQGLIYKAHVSDTSNAINSQLCLLMALTTIIPLDHII